jgi:hypothetical protein
MMTPARFYDPSQGRFTARDVANVHNGYAGFGANPIMNVDPTGQSPLADFILDAIYVVTFVVAAVFTAGAAVAAGAAIFGAAAAAEVTAASVATLVGDTVATVANAVGFASNGVRLADDISNTTGHGHFLSDDQRNDLSSIATVAGTVAGVAGMLPAAEATFAHGAAEFTGPIQQPEIAGELPAPTNPDNAAPGDPNAAGEPDAADGVVGTAPPNRPPPPIPVGNGGAQVDNFLDPNAGGNPEADANPEGQPNVQQPNVEQPNLQQPNVEQPNAQPQNAVGQQAALRVVNNLEGGADREIADDPAGARAVGQAVAHPPAQPNIQPPTDLAPAQTLANPNVLLQPNTLIQGNL